MSEIRTAFNPALHGAMSRSEAFEKYGAAASKAARTADFQEAGQKAMADLMSVKYEGRDSAPTTHTGRPALHPPPPRADGNKQETDGDLFTLLMAMISELIGEVDVKKLKNRLAMLHGMAGARQQAHENLSAEYTAAVAAMEAAEDNVGSSQAHLEKLRDRVLHFQGLLDESEARLAQLDPESPEYAQELARREQLKGEVANHTQAFNVATDAHLKLIEVANACAKAVGTVFAKVVAFSDNSSTPKPTDEKALSSSALALLNRLKIIELLGESAQNKEELNQELFQELQARLQAHMQRESEKYLEEVRKAEALQKTMGCIGKIVGAILIVASVLSFNPVLIAVAVVGAAVMIADSVIQDKTGVSFMAEAMKPLAIVMQEAIKLFTEIYTKMLIGLGVDEDKAKEIAQIAGMIQGIVSTLIAVALAVVVGVLVIGPMVSAVASKLASVVAQATPAAMQAMKQVATSVGNTLTQMLTQLRGFITNGADPVLLARYAANLEIAQAVTEFGNVAVQGGLQIKSGQHQAQAAVHLADVRVRMAISEEISAYLTQVVANYGQAMQERTRQIEHLFADMQRSHSVSLQMVRHV
ncbi:type III secretion system translocon subunit SctE [Pseudomonas sp. T1.Ur]|uniref:type III secretion system translocon subunit SctE n=1 Tax=Pseudomonas sp. T1.Ur TaxID=2928704 RepID=UPI00201E453C|nr:type III secretion system translocon subunit SctE [Pseudomonas sp. T1.Ur]MCL6702967.1 type III secretion system translocon subunit SctE [Pseudomonas sp. T1.Ur]